MFAATKKEENTFIPYLKEQVKPMDETGEKDPVICPVLCSSRGGHCTGEGSWMGVGEVPALHPSVSEEGSDKRLECLTGDVTCPLNKH